MSFQRITAISETLCSDRTEESRLVAAASLVAFDGYLRPGEMIRIRKENVTPPDRVLGQAYGEWAVQVNPEAQGVRSKAGEFDDTILFGRSSRPGASCIPTTCFAYSSPAARRSFSPCPIS